MKRRDLLGILAGAFAWPHRAKAEDKSIPAVGFLDSASVAPLQPHFVFAFRNGLTGRMGFIEGRDVEVVYRGADGYPDRLPALAADLAGRRLAAIVAGDGAAAVAAQKAAPAIPIVFVVEDDPVALGLVTNPKQPEGNITGVSFAKPDLPAKRLALICELMPQAKVVGLLLNPANRSNEQAIPALQSAARRHNVELVVVRAGSDTALDAAFASLHTQRVEGLMVSPDPLFFTRREQIVSLAGRVAVPAVYDRSEYASAGGLISYGLSNGDSWEQAGVIVGRLLKGAKIRDLPVQTSDREYLEVNRKTATALGLAIPTSILSRADYQVE